MKPKFIAKIPEWSLNYIVNGDPEGLTDEEIKAINEYTNRVNIMAPTEEQPEAYFTKYPEFGGQFGACDVEDCICREWEDVFKYEVYRLDMWGNKEDGYECNDRWHQFNFETTGDGIRAFKRAMKKEGYEISPAYRYEEDRQSDDIIIIERKTGRPVFVAQFVRSYTR